MNDFNFAELHMPAVRKYLGELPSSIFFDIQTAPVKRDMQEATDLVLSVTSGDIAVRVRRKRYYERSIEIGIRRNIPPCFDWSIRAECRGHRTEIHKLRDGYARWYSFGYSLDDLGQFAAWWFIDLDKVRSEHILDRDWEIYPNGDGTAGMYIPISILYDANAIVADKVLDEIKELL